MPSASSHKPYTRRLLLLGIVAALLALAYVSREQTLPIVGGWLDVGTPPKKTDYVMLLSGDRNTRPFQVADLYQQKLADRVMITSSKKSSKSLAPEKHEILVDILVRCGVPENKITPIDSRCASTFDEAATLNRFLDENPETSFCVVTNQYHTRRTRWVFSKVLGPKINRVYFVSAPTDHFHAGNWWKHEEGFTLYLSEFFKFAFYWVRYGRGLVWMAALAITATTIVLIRKHRAVKAVGLP